MAKPVTIPHNTAGTFEPRQGAGDMVHRGLRADGMSAGVAHAGLDSAEGLIAGEEQTGAHRTMVTQMRSAAARPNRSIRHAAAAGPQKSRGRRARVARPPARSAQVDCLGAPGDCGYAHPHVPWGPRIKTACRSLSYPLCLDTCPHRSRAGGGHCGTGVRWYQAGANGGLGCGMPARFPHRVLRPD